MVAQAKRELRESNSDHITVIQRAGRRDALAMDKGAVAATQVLDRVKTVFDANDSVRRGHRRIGDYDVVARPFSDLNFRVGDLPIEHIPGWKQYLQAGLPRRGLLSLV